MFLTGIVEGFYGRQWSWQARRDYAPLLTQWGLNSYLYCPKGDPYLRRDWWRPWPRLEQQELASLAGHYRSAGLNFGVGLSPYALYQHYGDQERRRLREKLARIDELGVNVLAILFDDMPGDCPDLALRQAEILTDVQRWSHAQHLLMCPTYYSYDAQLESYFGKMPAHYWEELGATVPAEIAIMWTGNEVCAKRVVASDVTEITSMLRRPPLLWDNYPVNDGAKASQFLHLQPLPERDPGLHEALSGHFCNPMNQAYLSQFPLAGLAQLYGGPEPKLEDYFAEDLSRQLALDRPLFEHQGLQLIGAEQRLALAAVYRAMADPAAAEIADWLAGDYQFDPACLTD
ncbi:hyaluronidase [Halieaceae bacterium IMCC14734]|uniref:Hyaluronidase n=1 Tax=Candidatus Litorirhabdus singularis TaxID=2518993 RepID=A0ABT3TGH3_9GAMM|nr:beta-N-acetylglucosaminidase domain-containing protein [Candidatus Litorirhabdus singularis]MCX2981369.1 hyaluronidase [Candidatus Litorirhabdus singularis]